MSLKDIWRRNLLLNSGVMVDFEEQDVIPTTVGEYLPTDVFKGGRNYFRKDIQHWNTSGLYGYIDLGFNNISKIKLIDKDINVDISGIFLGYTTTGLNSSGGYLWNVADGILYRDNASSNRTDKDSFQYLSIYPKNQSTLDKLNARFYIQVEHLISFSENLAEYSPAPEDFNNLKGKNYALSQLLRKENILSLNGSFEEDDFIGLWLGNDKFVGFLDNQELTFDLTENYDDEFVVVKTLSEKGIIDNATLTRDAPTLRIIDQNIKDKDDKFITIDGTTYFKDVLEVKRSVSGSLYQSNMVMLEVSIKGYFDVLDEWITYDREIASRAVNDGESEFIHYGQFKVTSCVYNDDTEKTTIIAFDKMIETQKEYRQEDMQVTFPATVKTVFNRVLQVCGLETTTTTFPNSDELITEDVWVNASYTYRDVLSHIAQVSGSIIGVKDDKIEVYQPSDTGFTITQSKLSKLQMRENYGKINILNLTREPQHDNYAYPENFNTIPQSDRKELVYENNPIVDKERERWAPLIFPLINDLEYREFSADAFVGYGIFDVGDIVTVQEYNTNESYTCLITDEYTTHTQGMSGEVKSSKPFASKEQYVVVTDERREGQTTYILVDQANGKIQSLVEQIGDRTDKTTSLTQDVDSIEAYVRSTAVGTNLIPNLNALMEIEDNSYLFWTFKQGGLRTKFRTKARTRSVLSPTFLVEPDNRSISQFSKRFRYKGTALSGKAYIVPDTVYSYRCKRTNGSQPFTVNVIEYNESDTEVKKTSHTLNGQNTIETFTFTPAQNTMWVRLEFVTSNDNEFNIAEEMFVRGEPVQWNEDTEDIKVWAQSQLKILDDQITLESTRIDKLNGDIHNAGLDINAVNGITVWGKKFLIQNEAKDKDVFKVITVDGQEQVYMYGSIQSEGGEIAFDSENKQIKIGDTYLISSTSLGMLGIKGNALRIGEQYDGDNLRAIQFALNGSYYPFVTRLSSGTTMLNVSNILVPSGVTGGSIGSPDSSTTRFSTIYLQNQPNVSSDKRLKYNISHIDPLLLDEFEHLERKSFNTKHDDKFSFGYMAQDVERCLYKYIVKVWGYHEANNWLVKFKLLNKSESYLSLLYNEVDIIMAEVSERKIQRLEESDKIKNDRIVELQEANDNLQRQMDTLIEILKEKEVI